MLSEEQIKEIEDCGIIYHNPKVISGLDGCCVCPYQRERTIINAMFCGDCLYFMGAKTHVECNSLVRWVLCKKKQEKAPAVRSRKNDPLYSMS